jgi:hypothetical protein
MSNGREPEVCHHLVENLERTICPRDFLKHSTQPGFGRYHPALPGTGTAPLIPIADRNNQGYEQSKLVILK